MNAAWLRLPASKAHGSLPIVEVQVADVRIFGLLDTGASDNIMGYEEFLRLPQEVRERLQGTDGVACQVASGEKVSIHGKIELEFSMGSHIFAAEFYVADVDKTVLGNTFFCKYEISLQYAGNAILVTRKMSHNEDVPIYRILFGGEPTRDVPESERINVVTVCNVNEMNEQNNNMLLPSRGATNYADAVRDLPITKSDDRRDPRPETKRSGEEGGAQGPREEGCLDEKTVQDCSSVEPILSKDPVPAVADACKEADVIHGDCTTNIREEEAVNVFSYGTGRVTRGRPGKARMGYKQVVPGAGERGEFRDLGKARDGAGRVTRGRLGKARVDCEQVVLGAGERGEFRDPGKAREVCERAGQDAAEAGKSVEVSRGSTEKSSDVSQEQSKTKVCGVGVSNEDHRHVGEAKKPKGKQKVSELVQPEFQPEEWQCNALYLRWKKIVEQRRAYGIECEDDFDADVSQSDEDVSFDDKCANSNSNVYQKSITSLNGRQEVQHEALSGGDVNRARVAGTSPGRDPSTVVKCLVDCAIADVSDACEKTAECGVSRIDVVGVHLCQSGKDNAAMPECRGDLVVQAERQLTESSRCKEFGGPVESAGVPVNAVEPVEAEPAPRVYEQQKGPEMVRSELERQYEEELEPTDRPPDESCQWEELPIPTDRPPEQKCRAKKEAPEPSDRPPDELLVARVEEVQYVPDLRGISGEPIRVNGSLDEDCVGMNFCERADLVGDASEAEDEYNTSDSSDGCGDLEVAVYEATVCNILPGEVAGRNGKRIKRRKRKKFTDTWPKGKEKWYQIVEEFLNEPDGDVAKSTAEETDVPDPSLVTEDSQQSEGPMQERPMEIDLGNAEEECMSAMPNEDSQTDLEEAFWNRELGPLWEFAAEALSSSSKSIFVNYVDTHVIDWERFDELPCFQIEEHSVKDPMREQYLQALYAEFQDVFSEDLDVEPIHGITHHIEFDPSKYSRPFMYPLAFKYRDAVKQKIDELLSKGHIRYGISPYTSPLVIVEKADGRLRVCVDYRRVNAATTPDKYVMPRIDTIRSQIRGKVFSTLDLREGFNQIPMDPESMPMTAMATPWGTYEYCRMPFGLKNAPSTFQRFMDKILSGTPNTSWYIDDVIVYSQTTGEHLDHMREVMRRLSVNNLRANTDKSHLYQSKIQYLGLEFDQEGYRPPPKITPKMEKYQAPKSKVEVQRFLGLINYYKAHIPFLGDLAAPLYELTRKNAKFKWESRHQEAFEKLRDRCAERISLVPFDVDKPIVIYTDASEIAVGAVMTQDGQLVEFYSHKFTPTEQRYKVYDREACAIVRAIDHFEVYLRGRPFVIKTDHKPLETWLKNRAVTARHQRYHVHLQDYDFRI